MMQVRQSLLILAVALFVLLHCVEARGFQDGSVTAPKIAPASKEGQMAIEKFRGPNGLRIDLVAAEPLLANPVAFCFDEQGRIYVAETFRMKAGVTDNRDHMYWLKDDLACRTVEDRVAMYRKYSGNQFSLYSAEDDQIRLLSDSNGDGVMDRAIVFAQGFRRPSDGIAAGVLASRGKVWFACIPDLWKLEDTNGDGKADLRHSLHSGYGVHVSFFGHDLHGLILGPDGKLYFSIGDRGLHVKTHNGTIDCPDTGAVLRCNQDGSELELFAFGLRNPQKLAFDEYGNLFTCDNNADSGDQARWVHVVEGGDSGWRIGYQYVRSLGAQLGPWNAENLWHTAHNGDAAYRLPPLAHVVQGPSGLVYHPGTGSLGEKYAQHFYLCDFRGEASRSGVYQIDVKPKGASFEVTKVDRFVSSILATDVNFGPDGALYISDWVNGWDKTGKGRIYKIADPARFHSPEVVEVQRLLRESFDRKPSGDLLTLLAHRDSRIRQKAQFELANRGEASVQSLILCASNNESRLGRISAIWALGQIWCGQPYPNRQTHQQNFLKLASDKDAAIRAQIAKLIGDLKMKHALNEALALLRDPDPSTRFHAAMSVGKLGDAASVPDVANLLRENNNRDRYLRHAGVMALTQIKDKRQLIAYAKDSSAAVRVGVLLAMRRLEMEEIALFLNDPDPLLVLEAARAINDLPIPAALPKLAAMPLAHSQSDLLTYRVIDANFQLNAQSNATALGAIAGSKSLPAATRVEALQALGDWPAPSGLDRITGLWRPLPLRSAQHAKSAFEAVMDSVFSGSDDLCAEGAKLAAKFHVESSGAKLAELVSQKTRASNVRIESLRALAVLNDVRLKAAMEHVLGDADTGLRMESRRVLAKLAPEKALPELARVLNTGNLPERQDALAILGDLKLPSADGILASWLDKMLAGKLSAEVQLDLLDAARRRSTTAIQDRLKRIESGRNKSDPLANYRETLLGGDREKGRHVFQDRSELSCVRCHKLHQKGGEVGPDLSDVGKRLDRESLLESLVAPNKKIAKGFETIILALSSGNVVSGIIKSEDAKIVTLINPDGKIITVRKEEIEERSRGASSMPADLVHKMSKAELRDLVEFLGSLK